MQIVFSRRAINGTSTTCFAKLAKKYKANVHKSMGVSSRDMTSLQAAVFDFSHVHVGEDEWTEPSDNKG